MPARRCRDNNARKHPKMPGAISSQARRREGLSEFPPSFLPTRKDRLRAKRTVQRRPVHWVCASLEVQDVTGPPHQSLNWLKKIAFSSQGLGRRSPSMPETETRLSRCLAVGQGLRSQFNSTIGPRRHRVRRSACGAKSETDTIPREFGEGLWGRSANSGCHAT
jgi:hypothetical protein